MRVALAAAAAMLLFAVPAHAKRALGHLSCTACWDRVAYCESTGRWNIATGNGFYGGLQFTASSWRAYGGLRYASMPHYATRLQQIAVASTMSLGNWPVCGSRYWG